MIHLITLPNDENAKTFARTLRDGGFKVRFRGRGYRHGRRQYQAYVPLKLASKVAVYVSGGQLTKLFKDEADMGYRVRLAESRAQQAETALNTLKQRVTSFVQTA